jgi:hypothetical protein
MKNQISRMTADSGKTGCVLDCGGKRSVTRLSPAGQVTNGREPSSARKRRRRFALPAQSKPWQTPVARRLVEPFPSLPCSEWAKGMIGRHWEAEPKIK